MQKKHKVNISKNIFCLKQKNSSIIKYIQKQIMKTSNYIFAKAINFEWAGFAYDKGIDANKFGS